MLGKEEKRCLSPAFSSFSTLFLNSFLPLVVNPFPKQALVFMSQRYTSFENTEGKGEIAPNERFLIFPQCCQPVKRTSCHFHQI